jgi:hypothetical protein
MPVRPSVQQRMLALYNISLTLCESLGICCEKRKHIWKRVLTTMRADMLWMRVIRQSGRISGRPLPL